MLGIAPLLLSVFLLGCDVKKVIDESHYAEENTEAMLSRAQKYITESKDKEALIQLQTLAHQTISPEQDRWVRDETIRLYTKDKNFNEIVTYLDRRSSIKNISPDEAAMNLFEKAEAYHHMSYNHWAKSLGMGSPYRRSKDAYKAQKYYTEFLESYPNHPKAEYVKQELIRIAEYLNDYEIQLKEYKAFISAKRIKPTSP
jgi:tetratricopeptide (TPR) repeat protein